MFKCSLTEAQEPAGELRMKNAHGDLLILAEQKAAAAVVLEENACVWNEFEEDVMKTPGGPEKRWQDQTPFRLLSEATGVFWFQENLSKDTSGSQQTFHIVGTVLFTISLI